jgi:hypothetical protein
LLKQITEATTTNKFATEVNASITNPSHKPNREDLSCFIFRDKRLFRDNLLYVPNGPCRTKVLQECHNDLLVGHSGVAQTLELVSRGYCWPQPSKLAKEFVKSYDTYCYGQVT